MKNNVSKLKVHFLGIVVLLFCLVHSSYAAIAGDDGFSEYAKFEQAKEPGAATLRQFCDAVSISAMHTKKYYKKNNKVNDGQKAHKKAAALLNGLSKICLTAMYEKYTFEESVELTKQLIRLEGKLLKTKPLGSVNIELHNHVSVITSAMIFNITANCEKSELKLLKQFEKNRYAESHISMNMLKKIISGESGIQFKKDHKSNRDVLTEAIEIKYPASIESYKLKTGKKQFSPEYLQELYALTTWGNPLTLKSPLDEIFEISFASNYVTARKMALYARLSIEQRRVFEMDLSRRQKTDMFKEYIRKNITAAESEWRYHPKNEEELTQNVRDVLGDVRRYDKYRGREMLEYTSKKSRFWLKGNLFTPNSSRRNISE